MVVRVSESASIVASLVDRIGLGEDLPFGLRGLDDATRSRVRQAAHARDVDATRLWRQLLRTARRHAASRARVAH